MIVKRTYCYSSAFILVAGLMLVPAVSKGMAMSMTTIPELSMLLNPTSTQAMQGGGLNFAMDSAGFIPVSLQTAENMVKKGDPMHKYSLVAYETDLKLPRTLQYMQRLLMEQFQVQQLE